MRKKDNWALGLSVVAIIVAISSFAITKYELTYDKVNFLITILAILVTALIGWQIFNVINFENRLSKLKNEAISEFEEKVKIESEKITKLELDFSEKIKDIEDDIMEFAKVVKRKMDMNFGSSVIMIFLELQALAEELDNDYIKLRLNIFSIVYRDSLGLDNSYNQLAIDELEDYRKDLLDNRLKLSSEQKENIIGLIGNNFVDDSLEKIKAVLEN